MTIGIKDVLEYFINPDDYKAIGIVGNVNSGKTMALLDLMISNESPCIYINTETHPDRLRNYIKNKKSELIKGDFPYAILDSVNWEEKYVKDLIEKVVEKFKSTYSIAPKVIYVDDAYRFKSFSITAYLVSMNYKVFYTCIMDRYGISAPCSEDAYELQIRKIDNNLFTIKSEKEPEKGFDNLTLTDKLTFTLAGVDA